jgi:hypothetical protein
MAKLSTTSAGNLGKYIPGVVSLIENSMKTGTKIPVGSKSYSVANSVANKTAISQFAKLGKSSTTQSDALDIVLKSTTGDIFRIGSLEKPKTTSTTATGETSQDIVGKSLTPNGIKIEGKQIKKDAYLNTVKKALKENFKSSKPNMDFIVEFLETSGKPGALNPLKKGTGVTKKDIATIAKDFGEVAGAWWFINNYKDKKLCGLDFIEFPVAINEPLVDYYIGCTSSQLKIKISAKADAGAAPALKAIWKNIKNKPPKIEKEKKVWEFIKISVENDGLTSLVELNKHYNSKAYSLVGNLIDKTDYTWEDIEKWFAKYSSNDADELYGKINTKFYSKLTKRRQVDVADIKKLLGSKGAARAGILLSPMNYSLMDEVNTDKDYINYLNKVARTLGVEQLYVYLKATSVSYSLKSFITADFEFAYWSNAGKPANNKWGFKMKGTTSPKQQLDG